MENVDLFTDIFTPRPTPPKIVRVLWRMQGPSRVMVARIERHPFGRELIVAFEHGDDNLETRFERTGTAALERRADELRTLLLDKGWVETKVQTLDDAPHDGERARGC
jgi:hypothetical protein